MRKRKASSMLYDSWIAEATFIKSKPNNNFNDEWVPDPAKFHS
ncbi:hypothetical protein AGMMS49556_09340 [Endomicrobiia bacterium]|nr:hypothetical protein AGMMS49556_09340 [Endomicrobiia bacterium]